MNLNYHFPSNSTNNPLSSLPSLTLIPTNSAKTSFRPFKINYLTTLQSISIMKFFAFQKKKEIFDSLPLPISKIVKMKYKTPLKVFFLLTIKDLLNLKNLSFLCQPGFIQDKVHPLSLLKEH